MRLVANCYIPFTFTFTLPLPLPSEHYHLPTVRIRYLVLGLEQWLEWFSGFSTHGLTVQRRQMNTPPTLLKV